MQKDYVLQHCAAEASFIFKSKRKTGQAHKQDRLAAHVRHNNSSSSSDATTTAVPYCSCATFTSQTHAFTDLHQAPHAYVAFGSDVPLFAG